MFSYRRLDIMEGTKHMLKLGRVDVRHCAKFDGINCAIKQYDVSQCRAPASTRVCVVQRTISSRKFRQPKMQGINKAGEARGTDTFRD